MFLEIPIKLEGYVEDIKRHSRLVEGTKIITLIKIGETKLADKTKLMLLIYNPFDKKIDINCDFFTKNSCVYKLYPGEFSVLPNHAYAFVAYVSKENIVAIDEVKLIANMKMKISTRISSWYDYTQENNYEPHNIYKIIPNNIEIDKTINLNDLMVSDAPKFIDYTKEHMNNVTITIDKIEEKDKIINIGIKFINESEILNLKINGFKLKIFDNSKIIHIDVSNKFSLTARTTKMIFIQLNKIEFAQINKEKIRFKITLK